MRPKSDMNESYIGQGEWEEKSDYRFQIEINRLKE